VPNALSTDAPALATFPSQPGLETSASSGGYVFCAWKGQQQGRDRIYAAAYNVYDSGTWMAVPVPDKFKTAVGPTVGIDNEGDVTLCWTGSDNAIWTATLASNWVGSSSVLDLWSPQTRLPLFELTGRPALASPQAVNAAETPSLLAWKGLKTGEVWVGLPG
jgi:hypothetical protein